MQSVRTWRFGLPLALTLATVVSAAAAPVHHTKSHHLRKDCMDTALRQGQMDACAKAEEESAERRLDKSWREIHRYIDDDDQRQRLEASQKAWLAYRDAWCHDFYARDTGEMADVNEPECRASLAVSRAKELDVWPANISRKDLTPHD